MYKQLLIGILALCLLPISSTSGDGANSPAEPEMTDIPAGSFIFGCVPGRDDHSVACPKGQPPKAYDIEAFKLSKTEITFRQWDACVADKACAQLASEGWGRDDRPAINVRWSDAQQFIDWLNEKSGKHYRLPTEIEWEYAARANKNSPYPWGNNTDCTHANYGYDKCRTLVTQPVASFKPNAFGLHDIIGNAAEWTQGCWNRKDNCADSDHVLRGCSWMNHRSLCRTAVRLALVPGLRLNGIGFRLALD